MSSLCCRTILISSWSSWKAAADPSELSTPPGKKTMFKKKGLYRGWLPEAGRGVACPLQRCWRGFISGFSLTPQGNAQPGAFERCPPPHRGAEGRGRYDATVAAVAGGGRFERRRRRAPWGGSGTGRWGAERGGRGAGNGPGPGWRPEGAARALGKAEAAPRAAPAAGPRSEPRQCGSIPGRCQGQARLRSAEMSFGFVTADALAQAWGRRHCFLGAVVGLAWLLWVV